MKTISIKVWLAIVALLVIIAALIFLATNASAGIGPAGFAFYAQKGINHAIDQTYGKGNSPYNVHCTEKPNYRTLSDVVTCTIKEK